MKGHKQKEQEQRMAPRRVTRRISTFPFFAQWHKKSSSLDFGWKRRARVEIANFVDKKLGRRKVEKEEKSNVTDGG